MQKKKADSHSISVQAAPPNKFIFSDQAPNDGPAAVSLASTAELPQSVTGLVHEIQVHVDSSQRAEVRIQFDSSVFDGLRVDIRKVDDGAVSIAFTTNNDKTSDLLSKHVPVLSSALAARGVPVASIQFTDSGPDANQDFASNQNSSRERRPDRASKQRKRR